MRDGLNQWVVGVQIHICDAIAHDESLEAILKVTSHLSCEVPLMDLPGKIWGVDTSIA